MTRASGRIAYETGPDGVRLRIGAWPARTPDARGRIVLLHGRSEFIEKYAETIADLTGRGFAVRTMDWRGQGLSDRMLPDRRRGHVDSYETYLGDLDWFFADIGRRDGAMPTYVLAHSMGGHIALRALLEGRIAADGAILLAPMIELRFSRTLRAAARMAMLAGMGTRFVTGSGRYDPEAARFEGNPLTSDPVRFRRIHAAIAETPGVALGGPTWGWLDASFRSIARLSALAASPRRTCPILMCAAEADTVVPAAAQRLLSARLKDSLYRPIPGARHEILHEADPIRDLFWDAFDAFVGA